MQMQHALKVAASEAAGPEDILSVAGRLARDLEETAPRPERGGLPWPTGPALAGPVQGNLATLRECQSVLSRTLRMLA
jgi:hypothetical protein